MAVAVSSALAEAVLPANRLVPALEATVRWTYDLPGSLSVVLSWYTQNVRPHNTTYSIGGLGHFCATPFHF